MTGVGMISQFDRMDMDMHFLVEVDMMRVVVLVFGCILNHFDILISMFVLLLLDIFMTRRRPVKKNKKTCEGLSGARK